MHKKTIEEALQSGKPLTIFTVGRSMEPLLYERETLVVICRVDRKLKRGELPLYKRQDGKYVMHRIIRTCKNTYITRGDNQFVNETIPMESVIGVVREVHRRGKVIRTDSFGYKLYVLFWRLSYPVRFLCRKLYARIKRL